MIYPKMSPLTGMVGYGGGSSGLNIGGPTVYKGGSVEFDGSDDGLSIGPTHSEYAWDDQGTLEMWIKAESFGTQCVYSSLSTGSSALYGLSIYLKSTSMALYGYTNGDDNYDGTVNVGSSSALSTNVWYHIALTKWPTGNNQSWNWQYWLNGVSQGSTTFNSFNWNGNSRGTWIGRQNDYFTSCFHGKISNLRFVRGQRLYTDTFTPPTTLLDGTPTGCTLLCCQDESSTTTLGKKNSNDTASEVGNPSTSTDNPF